MVTKKDGPCSRLPAVPALFQIHEISYRSAQADYQCHENDGHYNQVEWILVKLPVINQPAQDEQKERHEDNVRNYLKNHIALEEFPKHLVRLTDRVRAALHCVLLHPMVRFR
jgi:hypothetical protein